MKMKQVTEQTGLTDRAVRLYVSKGLVFPRISEKYNGRKEIEFTEEDLRRLSQIAVLRKAGFSIPDIGGMIGDSGVIRQKAEALLERTREELSEKSEVAAALSAVLASDDPLDSLEALCAALTEQTAQTPLPEEDAKMNKAERVRRNTSVVLCAVAAALSSLLLLATPALILRQFRLPYLDVENWVFLCWMCGWLLAALALNVLFLFALLRRSVLSKHFRRAAIAIHSVTLLLFLAGLPVWGLGLCFGVFESKAEYPAFYMKLDDFLETEHFEEFTYPYVVSKKSFAGEIREVFPESIPAFANWQTEDPIGYPFTTKYYYRYSYTLDPAFDVFAEWQLPEEEYAAAKQKGVAGASLQVKEGDWDCFYYRCIHAYAETPWDFHLPDWDNENYYYLFFACNDATRTVRYAASYAVDSLEPGPYFSRLVW